MQDNGLRVLGHRPHVLGNRPHVIGNRPHVLGNRPHVLCNRPHVLGKKTLLCHRTVEQGHFEPGSRSVC